MMRSSLATILVSAVIGLAACDLAEAPLPGPSTSTAAASLSASPSQGSADLTHDVAAFTAMVQNIRNDNEVLVWVKAAHDPGPDPNLFLGLPAGVSVVAMHAPVPGASVRTSVRLNRVAANAAKAPVAALLRERGATVSWVGSALPVMAVRVPDSSLQATFAALLAHDNVDWIEANQRRRMEPTADPVGTNPTGLKHSRHFVQSTWDHTRGAGAKPGIMDSRLAGDTATSTFHPDLQRWVGGGVIPLGFVDDGGNCNASQKAKGQCLAYDDHGHGTVMAGLAGANDNSLPASDPVGIAPMASIYSMKIAFNADRPGLTCDLLPIGDDSFCIEDDDLIAGIDWAADSDLDVLSMSFSGNPSGSIRNALSYAYNNDDILLLAALGNDPGSSDGYVKLPWVMG